MKYMFLSVAALINLSCTGPGISTPTGQDSAAHQPQPPVIAADTLPVFETYGELPPQGYLYDADTLTERYGFKLKNLAGCEVDGLDLRAIQRHNRGVRDQLAKKYGEQWLEKFERETHYKLAVPFD